MNLPSLESSVSSNTFEAKVLEARRYEKALATWFQRRFGAYVLPTYDYSGLQENKAPKLMSASAGLVIPDLLLCRNGKTTWAECKWKTNADLHRKTGHFVTGINARHFSHYKQVKNISGCDVVIMFLHILEGEMRGDEIDALPEVHHLYEGKMMGKGGMVFWQWDKLRRWCHLEDVMRPQ